MLQANRYVLCVLSVCVQGALAGRSLLGHAAIVVVDGEQWQACVREAVGWVYFKSVGSVYDHAVLLGFGSGRSQLSLAREGASGQFARGEAEKLNGTQKKEKALLGARRLLFTEKMLASNLKRLTNGRTAPKKAKADALLELLAACERVG